MFRTNRKKRHVFVTFSIGFVLLLLTPGHTFAQLAPSFEWVAVLGGNAPGGVFSTVMAKVVGPSPMDIQELSVSREGGGYSYWFTEDDIVCHLKDGMYYSHETQVPPDGTYTFFVEDYKGRTAYRSQSFTFSAIPIVSSGIAPADSAYVNTTTPVFSWDSVGPGYYYRIVITYWNYEGIVYTSSLSTDTAVTVPEGTLLPNTPYKWRVEVLDGHTLDVANNRSITDWMRFFTGPYPYTLGVSFGIVWSDNRYSGVQGKLVAVHIVGPMPHHVSELRVTGPGYLYNFTEDDISCDRDDGAIYIHGGSGYPSDGTYEFYVEDWNLANDTYSKDFTLSEIPIADMSTFFPENNAYLNTFTPTLSWGSVPGSPRYYRVLIMDWRRKCIIYESPRSTDTFATIPPGILKPNSSYMWRVGVYDGPDHFVSENRSTSGWYCFTTPSESLASVSMTPEATVIPRGGNLRLQVTITNNRNKAGTLYFATKVTLPNGNPYPPSGYLFGPKEVTLNPYQSKSGDLAHTIPMGAPLGTYIYHGYIGRPGMGIIDEDQFDFEIIETLAAVGPEAWETTVDEDFAETE